MANYIPNNSPYRELSGDEEEEPLTNFKVAVEAVREKEDDELADPGAIVAGIQEQQAAKKTAKKKKPVEPKYTWTPYVSACSKHNLLVCHPCRKGADFILTRLLDEKLDEKLHAIIA